MLFYGSLLVHDKENCVAMWGHPEKGFLKIVKPTENTLLQKFSKYFY